MPSLPPRKQHNASPLLLQNLLSCHPGASPFTLVQDTLEQPARELLRHFVKNSKSSKTSIIYVSYESLTPLESISTFIKARQKSPEALRDEIIKAIKEYADRKILLIFDTLHSLSSLPPPFSLPTYLSSLLSLSPHLSFLAVYHLDVPLPPQPQNPYAPSPLTLLRYLATTILTTHSLSHTLAKRKARDRSLQEPNFGVDEEVEGVIIGLKDPSAGAGMVLEMEHRRKSGRVGGGGMFYLPPSNSAEKPMMLDEHHLFKAQVESDPGKEDGEEKGTFELGLTEKQRKDREGIVLPYFDAQLGNAEGGKILYDMGVEDDFDEEEDEI